ncbi:MAG: ABC transporter permease subunit [Candidatus Kaiserbacteria bacterium]|nr:ABC transporter permease subunit [Candidatus Kaiserbacteria bacterium]
MIRSIAHPQNRAWHRAHLKRHRRAWVIMAGIVIVTALLVAAGYFSGVAWPILGNAVFHTTYRLVVAYSIALVLGVSIALLVGWSPFSDALFPVFDILQNIPSFALIPFFIFFFGLTDQMVILFAVSSIVWPILFAVLTSIKNAHTDLSDAATIFGARGLRRIPYYLAPLSVPAMLTGSIVGIAIGWEAVIGAEIIVNISGFGSFIRTASVSGINQATLAGMLVILIIVFVVNRMVWAPLLAESAKRYSE